MFKACRHLALVLVLQLSDLSNTAAFTANPYSIRPKILHQYDASPAVQRTTRLTMSDQSNPSSFREAEVLGLKLMQEQKYEEALDGRC